MSAVIKHVLRAPETGPQIAVAGGVERGREPVMGGTVERLKARSMSSWADVGIRGVL
jgi:hypothetical protein